MSKSGNFLRVFISIKPYSIIFLLIWSLILIFISVKIKMKELKLGNDKVNLLDQQRKVKKEYLSIDEKKNELETQTQILSKHIQSSLKKEELVNAKIEEINFLLSQVSGMTEEEARDYLFEKVQKELKDDLGKIASKRIKLFREDLHSKITKIICSALERYSSEIAFSKTVDYLIVDNKKTVSRIIGKDGRNITFFRKLTGTDIIIDKEKSDAKKKANEIIIEISSFDTLRREVALQTLKKLIENEQKITPLYIESSFNETRSEIDELIIQTGEKVLDELQIVDVNEELVKHLGRLKYRTSYGQNVLEHSLEVAKLSGTIAAELGLDSSIAKRAGLFHDIGKSAEDLIGSSHVTSGVMLAKKYNESEIVINAIASHHDRILATNPYSLIVSAADTLSAARPGARSSQLESYITRMKGLEDISKEIDGIKKIYPFQAGREVWVIVDSNKVDDFQAFEISKTVKRKIQERVVIPGDITILVIREKKIIEKIVNSGRVNKLETIDN